MGSLVLLYGVVWLVKVGVDSKGGGRILKAIRCVYGDADFAKSMALGTRLQFGASEGHNL